MTYYNTTKETGPRLQGYQQQANTQDQKIASFFELNPGEIYTPWEVQSIVFGPPAPPITSVRRSMNTLTRAGVLDKTEHKKEAGDYGRRSYCWTLNEAYRESMEMIVHSAPQELLDEIDADLGHQDPPESPREKITPSGDQEDQPERKSENKPKTGPQQGYLFG